MTSDDGLWQQQHVQALFNMYSTFSVVADDSLRERLALCITVGTPGFLLWSALVQHVQALFSMYTTFSVVDDDSLRERLALCIPVGTPGFLLWSALVCLSEMRVETSRRVEELERGRRLLFKLV